MNSIQELVELLALYQHRAKSRQALLQLNSSQLEDIGLTREQAIDEASRPFWAGNSALFENSLRTYKKKNMEKFVFAYPRNKPNYILSA